MAINLIVQDDNLTVYGPPQSLELAVDIGPKGDKGNKIYTGPGDPNVNTGIFINDPAQISDLFVRNDLGGDYGVVYQYKSVPGGNEWQAVLKFQPITYSTILEVPFTSGSASFLVPLTSLYVDAPLNLTADDISVQLTPQHTSPVSITVSNKILTSGSSRSLQVSLLGKEISGSITNLAATISINVNVSIVI
jgi:hypothetical protein